MVTMMEDLVHELAELQAEHDTREAAADKESTVIDVMIANAEENLVELKASRRIARQPDEIAMGELDVEIAMTHERILAEWDGKKRTTRYPDGMLKMRTSRSMDIKDGGVLLVNLMRHFTTPRVATDFISGFNKTAVRKFVDLHPLPGAVELVSTTSVKLEVK